MIAGRSGSHAHELDPFDGAAPAVDEDFERAVLRHHVGIDQDELRATAKLWLLP